MSSFERYQRNLRNRSSKGSQSNNNMSSKISIALSNNSKLSPSKSASNFYLDRQQIVFKFISTSEKSFPYYLNLTNKTGSIIYFKIKISSQNANLYKISPFEEVIKDQQSLSVKFQLNKNGKLKNHFLKDKFEIQWGILEDRPNAGGVKLTHRKKIDIRIIDNQPLLENRFTLGAESDQKVFQSPNGYKKHQQQLFKSFDSEQVFGQNNILKQQKQQILMNNSIKDKLEPLKFPTFQKALNTARSNEYQKKQQEQAYYEQWVRANQERLIEEERKLHEEILRKNGYKQNKNQQIGKDYKKISNKKTLLTQTNIILVALISFLIGFITV